MRQRQGARVVARSVVTPSPALFDLQPPRSKDAKSSRVKRANNSVSETALDARSPYDGASVSRRTAKWRAPSTTPNSSLYSLTTLRDRSRAAVRNDGYAKGTIDKLVTEVIGTGITPLSQARDAAFRVVASAKWLKWTDESDADGLLDFYGQQTQVCRGWFEAGEIFVRLRPRLLTDNLTVPLQLQVLEPELCPHNYDAMLSNGNRVRAGIEFDQIGRRVAFYFYQHRPGDPDTLISAELRRIPAENIIHLFDPLRAGQLRGLPLLTPALVRLYELDKFDDAILLRHQLANLFVGFIKSSASSSDTSINPLTGEESAVDNQDRPMVALEPGTMQELDPGDEVDFAKPQDPAQTYPDFMRQQLLAVAAATGVPYEVITGDMSKVNDRTVRVILNAFRRRIQAWQHQIVAHQLCRRVWTTWMDRAFLSASLPIPVDYVENPTPYAAVKWQPQGWPYLQPVQDIEAKKAAIRAGITSRANEVSETGEDAELIDHQQAADNARADELGLRYDSDGRQASSGPKITVVDPAADPQGAPA